MSFLARLSPLSSLLPLAEHCADTTAGSAACCGPGRAQGAESLVPGLGSS